MSATATPAPTASSHSGAKTSPDGRSRRWEQRPDQGVATGVLAGIGYRLGIDPMLVRIVFVGLAVCTGGLAVVGYGLLMAFMPIAETSEGPRRTDSFGARFNGAVGSWRVAVGGALLALAVLLVFRELGFWLSDALVWPLILAAAGITMLLRIAWQPGGSAVATGETAADERTGISRIRLPDFYRGGFGVALVVGAALLFLSANNALGPVRDVAMAVIVGSFAIALIALPLLYRWGRALAAERDSRIRSEERAEVAAHLHDSVLQTLALVQKRSDDPAQVVNLARRQERELRNWLFSSGRTAAEGEGSLMEALREAAEQVEDAHGVVIEIVQVGDRPLDSRLEALVGATREALTNAAKFAPGSGAISLYAEVSAEAAEVFVRDRGPGFDPDDIPGDRRGLRDSIRGRMERHGGTVEISSDPEAGKGTEVSLRIECESGADRDADTEPGMDADTETEVENEDGGDTDDR